PIKTKAWPDRWKPFIKAWKKIEESIGKNKELWLWTPKSISLANEQGNTYSVKKIVEFLRNKSISTLITQNNLTKKYSNLVMLFHCN
ncbi:23443_t:CDS:1, partial [Cetraspora pellucida]